METGAQGVETEGVPRSTRTANVIASPKKATGISALAGSCCSGVSAAA
jgi:hypothetical protein